MKFVFLLLSLFFGMPVAHAQQTYSTVSNPQGSLLDQQNQALVRKILEDARTTRAELDKTLAHGRVATPVCDTDDKLYWDGTAKSPAWACAGEADGIAKTFAKTNLPVCSTNEFLYPTSTTTLGCRLVNTKGAIGSKPAWQWSADTYSLRVQDPAGVWGPWVYLRGDQGCYFKWLIGAWGGCNSVCGPGTQTRTVTCQRNCSGVVTNVADGSCAVPKPATSQACNPGYTYSYGAWGAWSACSNSCGSGTQTHTRTCDRCDGASVACSNCGGVCSGSQACTDYSGCTYSWVTGAWSTCSSSCGPGTQTRTVVCRRSDGTNVADALCSGAGAKPATSQACNPGYTYSYTAYGAWGSCSGSCGSGTQTRTRSCQRCDGATVACSNCGGACSQSQACNPGYTYSYTAWGAWGSCSGSCGSGTQTRSRSCQRCDGASVACSNCGGACSGSQSCNPGYTYSWNSGSWSACSTTCGTGTQTRSVTCRRCDGSTVADSYCGGGKPATSQSCNAGYTYSYGAWSSWGSCSVTCGGGTQTRTRSCNRCDGASVACSNCGGACSESQSCNTQACGGSSGGGPCGGKSFPYTSSGQYCPCCGYCCSYPPYCSCP